MTLEQYRRELLRSAFLAIALVPALGAVPDDSFMSDSSRVDAGGDGENEAGYATPRFESE